MAIAADASVAPHHAASFPHTNIYVANLPPGITLRKFRLLFGHFGSTIGLRLVPRRKCLAPVGLVQYTEPHMAAAAIAHLDGSSLEGYILSVTPARRDKDKGIESKPSANLYVANLPARYDEPDVQMLFEPYGPIHSLRILRFLDTGASKGTALVRFETMRDAERARNALHCALLGKHTLPLEVKFAESREDRLLRREERGGLPQPPEDPDSDDNFEELRTYVSHVVRQCNATWQTAVLRRRPLRAPKNDTAAPLAAIHSAPQLTDHWAAYDRADRMPLSPGSSCGPQRLYCGNCDQTYSLPQGGSIKEYKGLECPLDNFQLVVFQQGGESKVYTLCPYCYNNPPFEDVPGGMGCNSCRHPTCKHSLVHNRVCACQDPVCDGFLVLDPVGARVQKMDCNRCNRSVKFPTGTKKVSVTANDTCEGCGSNILHLKFEKDKSPLTGHPEEYSGCILCDDELNALAEEFFGKGKSRGKGKGRGKGRGRGRGKSKGHRGP